MSANSSIVSGNGTNASEMFNEETYLAERLGDRHAPLSSLVILFVVYGGILITGTVGNICTCIVIARNRTMHTATNYYLFSLAVSDLITLLLALPPELYGFWEAYPWRFDIGFCIMKSFISEMTSYASVLTITAFTIERFAAICHPMRFQTLSSLPRAMKVIFVIWIIASVIALPYPLHTRTFYVAFDPVTSEPIQDSLVCNIPYKWHKRMTYMFQVSTFVFFVLPMIIIIVMYVRIGITLNKTDSLVGDQKKKPKVSNWVSKKGGSQVKNGNSLQVPFNVTKARKAVLKMLFAVVIAFFACWAPFHSQRLMTIYVKQHQWTKELYTVQDYLFYISGALYFFNSTINPILYNLMSKKYQQAFKRTLCNCTRMKEYDINTSFQGSNSPNRERTQHIHYCRISKMDKSHAHGPVSAAVDASL
ncbi:neuropeptides capa receptor-like [Mizuhopecten yessoensis]|uniref:Neuropeptides capa receptor n=1 Tax=Mizuhopecten yessoensis TaxID=6573 RepID=A0A210PMD5_MIZYE|nr:neuropeptides capa receptor-like [Mizuhopecten yessoensis]OWF37637.1 Neuropeptides capa receptor [Mizuhopecten yessoensis]